LINAISSNDDDDENGIIPIKKIIKRLRVTRLMEQIGAKPLKTFVKNSVQNQRETSRQKEALGNKFNY